MTCFVLLVMGLGLGFMFSSLRPSLCMTCFVLLVMGLGLGFVFSSLRASHCTFCTFKCALLFGLLILSLFSSLVPLIGVFPLFIYLGNIDLSINMKKKLKFFCLHLHGTLNLLCE